MFIKDYITRYKESNSDDKITMLFLTFWPFTTIMVEILINIMKRGEVVNTCSINHEIIYSNSLHSICEEAANNLNLCSINRGYGIFSKNGGCLINIEPKLKSNLDYITININGDNKIIKINKYASLTAVKAELVKIIVDLYNEYKVKV